VTAPIENTSPLPRYISVDILMHSYACCIHYGTESKRKKNCFYLSLTMTALERMTGYKNKKAITITGSGGL
jgi:hypothetical protein